MSRIRRNQVNRDALMGDIDSLLSKIRYFPSSPRDSQSLVLERRIRGLLPWTILGRASIQAAQWYAGLFSGSLSWLTDDEIQEGILEEKTVSQGFSSPGEIMSDLALNWLTVFALFSRRPALNRTNDFFDHKTSSVRIIVVASAT